MKAKDIERISKALGDPHRLQILEDVKKHGWRQCADICESLPLAQPSISHHLKLLVDSGLLIFEKEGRSIRYTIDKEVFENYLKFINSFTV